jgi:hypothetical protein
MGQARYGLACRRLRTLTPAHPVVLVGQKGRLVQVTAASGAMMTLMGASSTYEANLCEIGQVKVYAPVPYFRFSDGMVANTPAPDECHSTPRLFRVNRSILLSGGDLVVDEARGGLERHERRHADPRDEDHQDTCPESGSGPRGEEVKNVTEWMRNKVERVSTTSGSGNIASGPPCTSFINPASSLDRLVPLLLTGKQGRDEVGGRVDVALLVVPLGARGLPGATQNPILFSGHIHETKNSPCDTPGCSSPARRRRTESQMRQQT